MKVTVFTPTYNRGYIIENLYDSLKKQTNKNFEWLIIDDGSTDNTNDLFEKWILDSNPFEIRYYKKENGGKCSAINKGLDYAKGELFFTVDSDDYLTDDAIEKIIHWEKELPKNKKYCGFAGNLGCSLNNTNNKLFENGFFDGNAIDRYGEVEGERSMVFYTDIHKKYKYPIFEGEKFMTEAVTWNRMAHDGYQMRFYNDIIWVFEYQEDGLTNAGHKLFINNPKGYGLWYKERIEFTTNDFMNKFKGYYSFYCDLKDKYSISEISTFINVKKSVVLFCALLNKIKKLI